MKTKHKEKPYVPICWKFIPTHTMTKGVFNKVFITVHQSKVVEYMGVVEIVVKKTNGRTGIYVEHKNIGNCYTPKSLMVLCDCIRFSDENMYRHFTVEEVELDEATKSYIDGCCGK